MQHIYKCYVCHALQFTLYMLSMDLHRVPCVVFDQAAVSAQSDLAGATAPRRRNSTALWSLPAELAAVSTHKFLGYLERGGSVVGCRTRNRESPGSNPL